jgi:hypothetical protein
MENRKALGERANGILIIQSITNTNHEVSALLIELTLQPISELIEYHAFSEPHHGGPIRTDGNTKSDRDEADMSNFFQDGS